MHSSDNRLDTIAAAYERLQSWRAVARELGLPRSTVRHYQRKLAATPLPVADGQIHPTQAQKRPLPAPGEVRRYIVTCAQNNTYRHEPAWENMLALAAHYDAEILISRFAYNTSAFGQAANVKPGAPQTASKDDYWYDEELKEFFCDERIELAPRLVFCGESNISPTAVRPLSGMEGYTGRDSAIFPHVKIAMQSIPSGKHEGVKLLYTTGCITQRNYIQRKAGLKAEFHHCFHPDTEFLTRRGLRTLRQVCGTQVEVWSGESWEQAEIRSFGQQHLNEIVLAPAVYQNGFYRSQSSKLTHTLLATPDHTWYLADGRQTQALRVGDVLPASTVIPINEGPDFEEGVRHGLVFGDGSTTYRSVKTGEFSHQVCLHGEAASRWSHLFENITRWASREHISNYQGTAYYKAKRNFKELPPGDTTPAYIRGFFVGWVAADGHLNKRDGSIQLCSVTKYALDWAVKAAPYAGFTATGLCRGGGDFTTFGRLREPMWRLTLSDAPRYWKVASISDTPGEHEVMCAVVEPSHKFTLAGGILTGNCYGASIVEVNDRGHWFVRQLNADSETGDIYDLDVLASGGEVTTGNCVEAVTFGDIHAVQVDPTVAHLGWGPGGMLDVLKPKEVHLHDLLDFRSRNHHDRGNPHIAFKKYVDGNDNVFDEVHETAQLLGSFRREGTKVYVVQSNHDDALTRWLREADYRTDPTNALFFLQCQYAVYQAIAQGRSDFHLLEWVMRLWDDLVGPDVRFLRMDESHILVKSRNGGIECGMHGHMGPNGARGNPLAFSRMGRKANIGHSHTAGIVDGVYVAGTSSNLDLTYNVGPSSWTHTHIVTYPNGKRTLVTMYDGGWRAC